MSDDEKVHSVVPPKNQVPSVQQALNVQLPENFEFSCPLKWPMWSKRFERYLIVSNNSARPDNEKIEILLYVMGPKADEVFSQLPHIEKPTLEKVLKAFENYFIPRRNITFERYKFGTRSQQPGEPVEEFITALHTLADNCNYGQLKEELIRDRIIIGMTDRKTSEHLQLKATLTLSDTIQIVRQAELQSQQTQVLVSSSKETVNAVYKHEPWKRPFNKSKFPKYPESNSTNRTEPRSYQRTDERQEQSSKCFYCALDIHPRYQCPAKRSKCHNCKLYGHWSTSTACKSKKVIRNVSDETEIDQKFNLESEFSESLYLGILKINSLLNKDDTRYISLCVKELKTSQIKFLIDSGADITCLPASMINFSLLKKYIKPINQNVVGPDNKELNSCGIINLTLLTPTELKIKVLLVKNLMQPILGWPEIKKLDLLTIKNKQNKAINIIASPKICDVEKEFPNIFDGLGNFKGEIKITLIDNPKPFIQSVPRVVPIPLLKKLKDELTRLKKLGIIEKVNEPTRWVAPIVVVPKGDGIRLCCDFTELNKSVMRPHFPINSVEITFAQLAGAKYFTKIDLNSGFHQLKLDRQSQDITCFITPFGRWKYTRLPFGIACAPELFSYKVAELISGIPNVVYHIDDFLIFGSTQESHDKTLHAVLSRFTKEGVTINRQKSEFNVKKVTFLGHIVSGKGVSIDPKRVSAIVNFPTPTNRNEILQFLGMVNFAARFLKDKSKIVEPLINLLKDNVQFTWDQPQKLAFEKIKTCLTNAPTLAFFDPSKQVILSADSSSYGLGACLFQVHNGTREIVAYASRTLRESEKRYAQIEKEALALTWGAERFKDFILGLKIILETDHKPLIQIFQTKPLDDLSPRLMRFRIRMMRYNYSVIYCPGKDLIIPDCLSRNPIKDVDQEAKEFEQEVDYFVCHIVNSYPIKESYLKKIVNEQNKDPICEQIKYFCLNGWPKNKNNLSKEIQNLFQYRNDFSLAGQYLVKGSRIYIPPPLQLECLNFIHSGHFGITKCRERAKMSVWWYGLSSQLEKLIMNCPNCVQNRVNSKESHITPDIPSRPWQKLGMDLFKLEIWYLIITDYFSRYFEIYPLKSLTESKIIEKCKDSFSRFGIPQTVITDNGGQFKTGFTQFSREFDFTHVTSSPYYSQSNGAAEAAVKVAKNLITKNSNDLAAGLLAYRSTPLENGFSPAELLFNRKIRTLLPILPEKLEEVVDTSSVVRKETLIKNNQARKYNKRHGVVKKLSDLKIGDPVWISDRRQYGFVSQIGPEPRSYIIKTEDGLFRRNRWFLIPSPYYKGNKSISISHDYQLDQPSMQVLPSEHLDIPDADSIIENSQNTNNLNTNNTQLNDNTRPVRITKKPGWLADYVTDF